MTINFTGLRISKDASFRNTNGIAFISSTDASTEFDQNPTHSWDAIHTFGPAPC